VDYRTVGQVFQNHLPTKDSKVISVTKHSRVIWKANRSKKQSQSWVNRVVKGKRITLNV